MKILQEGSKAFDVAIKEKLLIHAKKVVDRDKQKELEDLLESLFNLNDTLFNLNDPKRINYPNTNVFLVSFFRIFVKVFIGFL